MLTAQRAINGVVGVIVFLAVASLGQGSPSKAATAATTKRATADDVCSFITGKLRSAVPQVPSLCVPKSTVLPAFELGVFSPTDVLEGKMRRAWSVALFEAAQELFFGGALNGTCQSPPEEEKQWFGCRLSVSDSYKAQHNDMHYVIGPYLSFLQGDPSSEEWYQKWWFTLLAGETFERAGSKNNAEWIGKEACESYREVVEQDHDLKVAKFPLPSCSLLLTTDSTVYIIIDFPDSGSPYTINYEVPLLKVFGKAFANTSYKGEVIFRSPWHASDSTRALWSYDLRWLGFLWEEANSGVRKPVAPSGSRQEGQTELHSLSNGARSRHAAIVRIARAQDGRTVIDLTNGSSWYAMRAKECGAKVGDQTSALTTVEKGFRLWLEADSGSCDLGGTFAGAW